MDRLSKCFLPVFADSLSLYWGPFSHQSDICPANKLSAQSLWTVAVLNPDEDNDDGI